MVKIATFRTILQSWPADNENESEDENEGVDTSGYVDTLRVRVCPVVLAGTWHLLFGFFFLPLHDSITLPFASRFGRVFCCFRSLAPSLAAQQVYSLDPDPRSENSSPLPMLSWLSCYHVIKVSCYWGRHTSHLIDDQAKAWFACPFLESSQQAQHAIKVRKDFIVPQ